MMASLPIKTIYQDFKMSTATLTKPKALISTDGDISICIQCLASYNEGTHHFYWCDLEALDLDNFEEEFQECIDYVIKTSPSNSAEEWFYTDHENLKPIYDEYQDIKVIKEYMEKYQEFKENNISIELMNEYLDNYGEDLSYSDFESSYRGAYDSCLLYTSPSPRDSNLSRMPSSA